MNKLKNGSVDSNQTIKAGCGIRYNPDLLDNESGFDFSNAEKLMPTEHSDTQTSIKQEQRYNSNPKPN